MTDDDRFEMIRVRLLMGLTESARIEFQSHVEQVRAATRREVADEAEEMANAYYAAGMESAIEMGNFAATLRD